MGNLYFMYASRATHTAKEQSQSRARVRRAKARQHRRGRGQIYKLTCPNADTHTNRQSGSLCIPCAQCRQCVWNMLSVKRISRHAHSSRVVVWLVASRAWQHNITIHSQNEAAYMLHYYGYIRAQAAARIHTDTPLRRDPNA